MGHEVVAAMEVAGDHLVPPLTSGTLAPLAVEVAVGVDRAGLPRELSRRKVAQLQHKT